MMYKVIFVLVATTFVTASSNQCLLQYDVYTRTETHLNVNFRVYNIKTILPNTDTAIIVHGQGGSRNTTLNPQVKDAFLVAKDMNVIVVDWHEYAKYPYFIAAIYVEHVGKCITDALNVLTNPTTTSPPVLSYELIHMVGFDLGAHVVGIAGRSLHHKVARITGLSPSRLGWHSFSGRLSRGDANYVEVIHTDCNRDSGHGIDQAIGQVDFFVNGGSGQPGCIFNNRCNHEYAWRVFALSILQNIFGQHCRNQLQVTLNTCGRGEVLIMGSTQLSKRGSGYYRVNT